jgi:hypothetical protein
MVGHVQVILEIINLHINLVILSPKLSEHTSWFGEVEELMDVIVSQGSLETIHELNIRPVYTRNLGVEL